MAKEVKTTEQATTDTLGEQAIDERTEMRVAWREDMTGNYVMKRYVTDLPLEDFTIMVGEVMIAGKLWLGTATYDAESKRWIFNQYRKLQTEPVNDNGDKTPSVIPKGATQSAPTD